KAKAVRLRVARGNAAAAHLGRQVPATRNNEAPPLDPRVAAALDKAVQATLPRRRHSVKEQLLSSTSPAALLIGDITEKVLAGKTAPVLPPRMPLATAA